MAAIDLRGLSIPVLMVGCDSPRPIGGAVPKEGKSSKFFQSLLTVGKNWYNITGKRVAKTGAAGVLAFLRRADTAPSAATPCNGEPPIR